MADLIQMPFGMVSVVGRGMDVLDGVHVPQREWVVSGFIALLISMPYLFNRNVFDLWVKS